MGKTNTDPASVRTRYDWSNTAPSLAIVNAVAAFENAEPTNLSETLTTPLFDHVDPEALNALVTDGNEIAISFVIEDYSIEIDGDGLTISDE